MTVWAQIENEIIVNIQDAGGSGLDLAAIFPEQTWVIITGADPFPFPGWGYRDGVILSPEEMLTVADVYPGKLQELYDAARNAITIDTFTSSALGNAHEYDSRIIDQSNLHTRYLIAKELERTEPLWADDGDGFEWLEHTSSELLAVIVDMNDNIKSTQVNFASKKAQLDAATTVSEVRAVTW